MYSSDSIEIRVPPEKVYAWFMHLTEHYQAWHPDHGVCRWISGKPFEVGSVLYAEEYLHGNLHKLTYQLIKVEPNKRVEFQMLFPISLIVTRGIFRVEPTNVGSRFTAELHYRFGKFLRLFTKKQLAALEQHQREEGLNLKRLLEEGG